MWLGVLWIDFNLLVSLVIELDRPLWRVVGSSFVALFGFVAFYGELLRAFAARRKVGVQRTLTRAV